MLAIKTKLKNAQKVMTKIKNLTVLDSNYGIVKKEGFIYFPVTKKIKGLVSVNIRGKKRIKQTKQDSLKKVLTKNELSLVKRSFDMVGTIAVLEIPKELRQKEKEIAEVFLKTNNIKTVLRKDAGHVGQFRTQKLKYILGEKTKVAIHKENKVRIKVDVEKVYFSVRLSEERKRIVDQIKKNEKILVMFSGCAPYPIVLAKNTLAKEIVGIEMNPEGHKYGLENLKLNKIKNIRLYCGDVKKVLPKLKETFDRIIMPLPKTSGEFLDVAIKSANKNAIINFYNFQNIDEFHKATDMIEKSCKKNKRKCKILKIRKVGQQSPRVYRICVDFRLN